MHYTIELLREDIHRLHRVTSGLHPYTPEPLWPQISLDDANDRLALNPNTPEAAAYDYFRERYGPEAGPDFAARFFAIHHFILSNVEKLARRGFLRSTATGPTPAEDLLTFLLTCFDAPAPDHALPRSIYDPTGGLALPFQDILADFHRLRALRARFANQGSGH